jgi:NAD(P)-dependent dehydrogenase (short-subunit alcohol dehydrogenase family)
MNSTKNIIIIGGAGRLGKAFVKGSSDEGFDVTVLDIHSEVDWSKMNINCDLYLQVNINDTSSLDMAIEKIDKIKGKIDFVVNSSYPKNKNYGKSVFNTEIEDFNDHIELHIGGYFNVMKKFAKYFITQGYGNLINISSIQGVFAPKFNHYDGTDMISPIEYTAAKASIIAMSKYMAKFLKNKNIRINCISPGGILDNQPESFLENYQSSCTSKGLLNPDDLLGALLFLISDSSKYMNGQNIIIDDGWTL